MAYPPDGMESPKTQAPVIFCHFGNSDYLQYTFRAARLFNPDKRIVLLGDASNRATAEACGIEHRLFLDYDGSPEIQTFDRVYRHIAGPGHGRPVWTNFVFKRWFYVHSFLRQEGIGAFWHFDSDNLLLAALQPFEKHFGQYDCTEQCSGSCMNGYVSSFDIADRYVNTINALFQDEAYLQQQQTDVADNPRFAFTEMRAYEAFREREHIRSIRLNDIVNGGSFDDCVCRDDGMETYDKPLDKRLLKKLYYTPDGAIYCKQHTTGTYIRMYSLNMSWVPIYVYRMILALAERSAAAMATNRNADVPALRVLDIYDEPLNSIVSNWTNNTRIRIKRSLVALRNKLRS